MSRKLDPLELCVSRETHQLLERFTTKLLQWNERVNLIGPATIPYAWQRHIVDSAQLLVLAPNAKSWLDLGSGGGLPGLVVAILLKERGGHITLVESNRKKAGFLQAVVGEFELPATVQARRIEDAAVEPVERITARALAPLENLLSLASPWMHGETAALLHKGREYRRELVVADSVWSFDLIEHRSAVEAEGAILEISHLRRRS